MAAYLVDFHPLYGIPDDIQRNAPVVFHDGIYADKLRWRFRAEDFAQVIVKTATGVRRFTPEYQNGFWHIRAMWEEAENRKSER